MKRTLSLFFCLAFLLSYTQETANRFYYQLSFKPKKSEPAKETIIMSLDITKDKSLFRDYTTEAQDSIVKVKVESMKRSGKFEDLSKSFKMPVFSYKIYKNYPSMDITYAEPMVTIMGRTWIGYSEKPDFKWQLHDEKKQIGAYSAQKATCSYGGRNWIAWFTTDIPFPDGPYKFSGLPGLIVSINDEDNEYKWELSGNKTIPNYSEITYTESLMPGGSAIEVKTLDKEKYTKTLLEYKKDPFATMRPYLTPDKMSIEIPGTGKKLGDFIKEQEKMISDFYNHVDNPVEKK